MIDMSLNMEAIETHNELRELHSCPPITYDADLAASAQTWADMMADMDDLEHSDRDTHFCPLGENIAMSNTGPDTVYSGSDVTEDWYAEIEDYDFQKENQLTKCGHFSQVVWKSTELAGFGRAVSTTGSVYICGQYSPPGNMRDCWIENVPLPFNGSIYIPERIKLARENKGGLLNGENKTTPRNPSDKLIGKSTKSRTDEDGVEIVTTTEKYISEDGDTYSLEYEETKNPLRFDDQDEPEMSLPSLKQDHRPISLESGTSGQNEPDMSISLNKDFRSPSLDRSAGPIIRFDNKDEPEMSMSLKKDYRSSSLDRKDDSYLLNGIGSFSFNLGDFRDELFEAINYYRSMHGVEKVFIRSELNDMAQSLANHMADKRLFLRNEETFNGNELNDNIAIFALPGAPLKGGRVADHWYQERNNFRYNKEPTKINDFRNFTQMIWRDSEEMGTGAVVIPDGPTWVVCFFYPAGNVRGRFDENVYPVRDD